MKEQNPIDGLIQAYLDETIGPEDLETLQQRLRTDPEAARRLARAARLDNALYLHFHRARAETALAGELAAAIPAAAPAPEARAVVPAVIPPPWRRFADRAWDHLWGPAGAVLLHAALLLILIRWVVLERSDREPGVVVEMMQTPSRAMDPVSPVPEALAEIRFELPPPELPENESAPGIPTPVAPPAPFVPPRLADFDWSAPRGHAALPLLAGRLDPVRRRARLDLYAGRWAAQADRSAEQGLSWLKTHQDADGAWRLAAADDRAPALTALSVLCFLARGETPGRSEYGDAVEKGLRFLLARQRPDGLIVGEGKAPDAYAHALATCALGEAYALTRIPALRQALEGATAAILRGQQQAGLWTYAYAQDGRLDVSVSCWQIQALKTAAVVDDTMPGLVAGLTRAADALTTLQETSSGQFYYALEKGTPRAPTGWATTGAAVLALQWTGQGGQPAARKALTALRRAPCEWQAESGGAWPLYSWYYLTQAMFNAGGTEWTAWNDRFASMLIGRQQEDGSWLSPGPNEQPYGPVYSTAFSTLALTVYYRYPRTEETPAAHASKHADLPRLGEPG